METQVIPMDNKLNELVTDFDSVSGWIKSSGNYVNGVKDGVWVYFGEHGVLKEKGVYKNGKRNGVWLEYGIKGGKLVEHNVFYYLGVKLIKFKNL